MLLKEVFNDEFLFRLAKSVDDLDAKKFLKILKKDWAEKSLKERMRAIVFALDEVMLESYLQKVEKLKKAAEKLSKENSLAMIIFPDFIEVCGVKQILKQVQDDERGNSESKHTLRHPELVSGSIHALFDESMNSLEFFTPFGSSEFAVRSFIKHDKKRAMKFFQKWSKSKNHHIRRLASEGCRPRLPWGEALPNFKKDPTEVIKVLENLKFDDSLYVQKSVANNLNDISKDNPQIVLDLLKKWREEQVKESLIKHALRTLLKKGNVCALSLIGISNQNMSKNFTIQSFALQKTLLKTAENLVFDFALENQEPNNKIRLEYIIYFLLKNGSHGKKNFQITTKNFAKGVFKFSKKHSLRDLSTRKHNLGKHWISLVVNGVEYKKLQFDLI